LVAHLLTGIRWLIAKGIDFMHASFRFALLVVAVLTSHMAVGREFTDKSGKLKVDGTLIAADDKEIVVKLDAPTKGRELLAIPIDQLSEEDQKWLQGEESQNALASAGERHSWTLRSGLTMFGKIVDFARRDITLQRRRGKLYVNDRPFENLPEVYRKMVPRIVEYFEKQTFNNDSEFQRWVVAQRAEARTFTCEGVLLEFENGDEYGIPFFFFTESDLRILKPYWDEWLAAQGASDAEKSAEEQRQYALYLQSQAAAYQQSQEEMAQIARLQLQMTAVAAGVTSMWEVFLYPPPGVPGFPISVVLMARNSDEASQMALINNPGYIRGPVRKMAGRYRW
jgi:hypothetical protein